MKKIISVSIILILGLCLYQSYAQVPRLLNKAVNKAEDKTKDRVEDKAEEGIENKIDKELDKIFGKKEANDQV